jgi:hypothetical protein
VPVQHLGKREQFVLFITHHHGFDQIFRHVAREKKGQVHQQYYGKDDFMLKGKSEKFFHTLL